MKTLILIAAAALSTIGPPAQTTPGTPIQGIPIGLEGDPGSIVVPRTSDRLGNVVFTGLAPGRYSVLVQDASQFRAPVSISIRPEVPAVEVKPYSIRPGRGRAYAMDAEGKRLIVSIPRAGGRIGVNVSSIFDRWGSQGEPGTLTDPRIG